MTAAAIVLWLLTAGQVAECSPPAPREVLPPGLTRSVRSTTRIHSPILGVAPHLAAADPDGAVRAGREALDRGRLWQYPWYDRANDDVRRIEVAPPKVRPRPTAVASSVVDLRWVVYGALGLLLVLLIYLLVRAFLSRAPDAEDLPAAGSAEPDDAQRIESLPFPMRAGRLDLLAAARRHYEQGDYGRAIVHLFSFQLVQLDRRQVIALGRGKTNRQYMREIGPRAALRRLVEQTMVAFEDVFFGNRQLDRARFESCWTRLGDFETLLRASTA